MVKVDEKVNVIKDNKICKEICTAQTNLISGFLLFDFSTDFRSFFKSYNISRDKFKTISNKFQNIHRNLENFKKI